MRPLDMKVSDMNVSWRRPSVVTAALFAAFGAWIWWYSQRFPASHGTTPGPAFYPRLLATCMIGLAIVLAVTAVLGLDRIEWRGLSRRDAGRWALMLAGLAGYVLVWTHSWYTLATFLFTFAVVQGFERASAWSSALFAAILTALMWALFGLGLDVPLQVVAIIHVAA